MSLSRLLLTGVGPAKTEVEMRNVEYDLCYKYMLTTKVRLKPQSTVKK
jgi:hypothetical protein